MNSFHRLANMKPRSERPNVAVNATKKQIAENGSEKQRRYHRDLVAFLKENGLNTVAFEKPRDGRECGRFINAMITVLKKHELFDTFFSDEEKVRKSLRERRRAHTAFSCTLWAGTWSRIKIRQNVFWRDVRQIGQSEKKAAGEILRRVAEGQRRPR